MPYKSDKQRRYMHAKHPEIAARWDAEIRAKKVKKAFEDHPKVKYQGFGIIHTSPQGQVTAWAPTHTSTHARGKSLVLRRPKYQVVGQPDKKLQKLEGTNRAAFLTRNMRVRHKDAVKFQEAYKKKATSVTLSSGQKLSHEVGKRAVNEKRLAHQKKLSAATSVVGSSIGLAGLGMLAASRKYPGALKQLPKVTAVGAGVGGVGGFNYASIQNQESKKKAPAPKNVYVVRNKRQIKSIKSGLEPVTKGLTTMDFGLSDVRQGESVISKRQVTTSQQRKRGDQGANVGQLAGPAVGYFGAAAHKGGKLGYGLSRSLGSNPIPSLATGARTAPAAIKGAAKPGAMLNTALKHPFMAAGTMIGGAVAGQKIGQMSAKPKTPQPMAMAPKPMAPKPVKPIGPKKPKQTIGKSSDWMNISEHQRRSRDSRRTAHRGENVAGIGGAVISGAAGHYAGSKSGYATARGRNFYPNIDNQITGLRKGGREASTRYKVSRLIGGSRETSARYASKPLIAAAKANPHAAAAGAGAAVMAGGLAVAGAAKANEKRHDRAVARLRRERVGKELVFKAYNPEEKRLRRTEHSATALSVGSGAAGAGAFHFGRKAVGAKGTGMKGLRAKSLPHFKTGLKNAGKAGGLGVTAVGLAVASDRVRNYRHGRGSTYRALHR